MGTLWCYLSTKCKYNDRQQNRKSGFETIFQCQLIADSVNVASIKLHRVTKLKFLRYTPFQKFVRKKVQLEPRIEMTIDNVSYGVKLIPTTVMLLKSLRIDLNSALNLFIRTVSREVQPNPGF